MAAARVASVRRLCVRYKYFFYVALLIVIIQMYFAYSFYSINQHNLNGMPGPNDTPIDGKLRSLEEGQPVSGQKHDEESAQKQPGCDLTVFPDALSAISRAKTPKCRQEIATVACKANDGALFPAKLPRTCPLQGRNAGEFIGCFRDNRHDRDMDGDNLTYEHDNSPQKCIHHCLRTGFQYAGLQYRVECWCAHKYGLHGKIDQRQCDGMCPGTGERKCGGYLANSVYHTGLGSKPMNPVSLVLGAEVEGLVPARVVYMLTINGRATRHVTRLIKALYHPHSYIYIHVDSRQDYLYRQMSKLAERFDNVRLTSWRMSTIWGGASLLTMLLRAMADLLAMTDWKWDFFVNLSESDFPIKKHEDLINFLTKYKKFNFVRSHSGNTHRFIRKQGLDRTFFECENRMWRLGSRELPGGIRMDGGSDWIGLNRQFIQYVINSQDELVRGLWQLYSYALLPAESFFHTVLQNSAFCTSMVGTNNLHLTNWNRKRGCKCQYKHIVDWCGCSPNDFTKHDWIKLKTQEVKPVFFARKFEPIVNQRIINIVQTEMLLDQMPTDMVGLNSYWQNLYHHEDQGTSADDAALTLYHSFARRTIANLKKDHSCELLFSNLLEANTYSAGDQMIGILVLLAGTDAVGREVEVESLLARRGRYYVLNTDGPAGRLTFMEAGTGYDPKEDLFRNYGGFFGPFSNISIRHVWAMGDQFSAQYVLTDPAMEIAMAQEEAIKPKEYSESTKTEFHLPMRPGVWSIKLLHSWQLSAEAEFLVTPLSYYKGRAITDEEAVQIHQGAETYAAGEDFSGVAKALGVKQTDDIRARADRFAHFTGDKLHEWIDSLSKKFYSIESICINQKSNHDKKLICPSIPRCKETEWSSLSPDPKSEMGEIDRKLGHIR